MIQMSKSKKRRSRHYDCTLSLRKRNKIACKKSKPTRHCMKFWLFGARCPHLTVSNG